VKCFLLVSFGWNVAYCLIITWNFSHYKIKRVTSTRTPIVIPKLRLFFQKYIKTIFCPAIYNGSQWRNPISFNLAFSHSAVEMWIKNYGLSSKMENFDVPSIIVGKTSFGKIVTKVQVKIEFSLKLIKFYG
jgi:hypothetical protein